MYTSFTARCLLFGTVFWTGATVLVLEIAAVRLLTPTFGSSLYVLSSVLSTILFALSLGYFIGGRLADRRPHHLPLYVIILLAGVSLLALLSVSLQFLEPGTLASSQVAGPLIMALLFFFLPALLLGMDSPYVIKLLTLGEHRQDNGAYVGTTFFWSTVGSIVGSLAAGFWLIPSLGVTTTLIYAACSLLLLGGAVPWLLPATKMSSQQLTRFLVLLLISWFIGALFAVRVANADWSSPDAIVTYDGLYSHIEVQEQRHNGATIRFLRRDTNHSSAVRLGSTQHVYSYTRFVDLYDEQVEQPSNMLMIGGGAYTIPRRVVAEYPSVMVDVVEIEPSLFQLAQQYFDLTDTSRIDNHIMDARVFLANETKRYDFIFTDAFNTAYSAPFHLATQEFFQTLQTRLEPDGTLIVNYVGRLTDEPDTMTKAMYHTIKSVFPSVIAVQSQQRPYTELQNIMFIVSNPASTSSLEELQIPFNGTPYTLTDLRIPDAFFATDTPRILTDDHAPVELLMARQLQQTDD